MNRSSEKCSSCRNSIHIVCRAELLAIEGDRKIERERVDGAASKPELV